MNLPDQETTGTAERKQQRVQRENRGNMAGMGKHKGKRKPNRRGEKRRESGCRKKTPAAGRVSALLLFRLLARGGSAAANLLLGRILEPAAFGEIAFWTTLLAIPDAIGTLGLYDALISWQGPEESETLVPNTSRNQTKDRTLPQKEEYGSCLFRKGEEENPKKRPASVKPREPEDQKSGQEFPERAVFRITFLTSLLAFAVLFGTAPFLARITGRPEQKTVLRLLALTLPATPWKRSTAAHVQLKLRFKSRDGTGEETGEEKTKGEGDEIPSILSEGRWNAIGKFRSKTRRTARYGTGKAAETGILHSAPACNVEDAGLFQKKKECPGIKNPEALYRRYLVSTLPGAILAPGAALLFAGMPRSGPTWDLQVLLVFTLLRSFLDAISGPLFTRWHPLTGPLLDWSISGRCRKRDEAHPSQFRNPKRLNNTFRITIHSAMQSRHVRGVQRRWRAFNYCKSQKATLSQSPMQKQNIVTGQSARIIENPGERALPCLKSAWFHPDLKLPLLFQDGRNLLAASLLDLAAGNVRTLLLGLVGTGTDLAFYTRGRQIPQVLAEDLAAAIGFVMLPQFAANGDTSGSTRQSHKQEEDTARKEDAPWKKEHQRKKAFLYAVRSTGLAVFPVTGFLAASAGVLVPFLLGNVWQGLSGILAVECIACALYPIHALHVAALRGSGKSGELVRLEGRKKFLSLMLLLPVFLAGKEDAAYVLALTDLAASLLALPLNLHPLKRALGIHAGEELTALAPALYLAALVTIPTYLVFHGGI